MLAAFSVPYVLCSHWCVWVNPNLKTTAFLILNTKLMSKKCPKPFLRINKFSVLCSYWKSDKTVKSKQKNMKLLTAGTKLTVDVDETAAGTNYGTKHSYYKCVKHFNYAWLMCDSTNDNHLLYFIRVFCFLAFWLQNSIFLRLLHTVVYHVV